MRSKFFQNMNRKELAFYWFVFAVLGLSVSGVFAGLIALARMPGFSSHFTNIDFFRRALAVHVDLAVLVWFVSLPVAFFHLLHKKEKVSSMAKISLSISLAGIFLLFTSAFSSSGKPYLSNYVSVISHPLFLWGIILFLSGVAFNYMSPVLLGIRHFFSGDENNLENSLWISQFGIRLAAFYFLLSLLVFAFTFVQTPSVLPAENYYEVLLWGGGHVLQFSNVTFMLVAWILILSSWKGQSILTRQQAFGVFLWLGLPILFIPFFASADPTGKTYREGFSLLMRWGIFPPVLLFLILVLPKVFRNISRKSFWDLRLLSFFLSMILILNGFIFGALVRGPNLMLPGHYHSSIGAVTLAFMGVAYVLLKDLIRQKYISFDSRPALFNVLVYGFGQLGFSAGMFIAGIYGMSRKTYGVEQQIKNMGQTIGLYIMGIGGAFAFLGGLIFAIIMLKIFYNIYHDLHHGVKNGFEGNKIEEGGLFIPKGGIYEKKNDRNQFGLIVGPRCLFRER